MTAARFTHLQCRAWLHAWKHKVTYLEGSGSAQTAELHLVCLRCKTERVDTYVRRTGKLAHRKYVYPARYLITNLKERGGRKAVNTEVRQALVARYAGFYGREKKR